MQELYGNFQDAKEKIKEGQGYFPMEIHTHIQQESVGNFACVMTQAVLAKVVFGTPGGCAGCFISLEKVNKDLTFKSYRCKI